jgi:putative ABC transport system substrate-binding protein
MTWSICGRSDGDPLSSGKHVDLTVRRDGRLRRDFFVRAARCPGTASAEERAHRLVGVGRGGPEQRLHHVLSPGDARAWVLEGTTFIIEARYAAGQFEKVPSLAAELIALKPDVLIVEGTPAAQGAKKASSTIPIVMTIVADPIGAGLVDSLARPGGNVTGLTDFQTRIVAKRLELPKQIAPTSSRVAVLSNPANAMNRAQLELVSAASPTLSVTLLPFEARGPNDLDRAFAAMAKDRAGSLLVLGDPLRIHAKRIVELAAKTRLPAVYPERRWPHIGGLMSYGTSYADLFRRAALYVDKILKGARPG